MKGLTYASGVLLLAVSQGHRYGFELMDVTGLPDGTVYPALRRMERAGWLKSTWEDEAEAHDLGRPARKNFSITEAGSMALTAAAERFPGVARTLPGGGADAIGAGT